MNATLPNNFARAVPQLPVGNVEETQRFYRDVLGFKIDWTWGENDYGAVSRDDTALFLCATTEPIAPAWCVINVSEVDELCAVWRSNGATILSEPEDKPWGLREFTVADNNGHRFRVGRPSTVSRHEKREVAMDVTFVSRLPSLAEYKKLTDAVGWTSFTDLAAAEVSLPKSLFSIVAEKEGELVGMARVAGDGAMFFYIMDVAVVPEMQGRGIGTALMNEVVEFIKNAGPENTLVGLFTGAPRSGFYARFGFEGPATWLYGMSARKLVKVDR